MILKNLVLMKRTWLLIFLPNDHIFQLMLTGYATRNEKQLAPLESESLWTLINIANTQLQNRHERKEIEKNSDSIFEKIIYLKFHREHIWPKSSLILKINFL